MMLSRIALRQSRLGTLSRFLMSGFDNFNRNRRPKKDDNKSKEIPPQADQKQAEQKQPKITPLRRYHDKTTKPMEPERKKEETPNQNQSLFRKRPSRGNKATDQSSQPESVDPNLEQSKPSASNQEQPKKQNTDQEPQQRTFFEEGQQHKQDLFQRRRPHKKTIRPSQTDASQQPKSDDSVKQGSDQAKDKTDKQAEQPQKENMSFEERINQARANNTNNKPAEEPKDADPKKDEQKPQPTPMEEAFKNFTQQLKKTFGKELPKDAMDQLKEKGREIHKNILQSPVNPWKNYLFYGFLGCLVMWYFRDWIADSISLQHINYSELKQKVMNDEVAMITIQKTQTPNEGVRVNFTDHEGKRFTCLCDSADTVGKLVLEKNAGRQNKIMVLNQKKASTLSVVELIGMLVGPLVLIYFIRSTAAMAKRGKPGNSEQQLDKMFGTMFGKGKMIKQAVNVKFSNVAGMDSAKKQITEFVDFLKSPERFHKLGARIPRGALLSGPPGTGKTLLAKACAGQAGVSFFSLSGSEFVEMYVGVGASRVRNLFKEARESAPSIIFIDEIDAVGKKRSQGQMGGNDEKDSTLNQLLVEMDGFSTKSNVVVFAATNKKELLDSALTRPGRFDRIIEVDLPDLEGRKQIFEVHLAPIKLDKENMTLEQYARRMATLTPGFSGADIANICNEAAILAARKGKKEVNQEDFELANDRVISGTQKKSLMTSEQRKIVAYHESGHAVVSWFVEGASPLLKLTITPRSKGSLGFAQYLPDDRIIHTKQDFLDKLCVMMAGRLTEELFFNRITTGAQDDLNKVSQLANEIVRTHGMTAALGNVSFHQTEYLKDYSEAYSKKIDEQVRLLVDEAQKRARVLIEHHRDKIEKLANCLLEKDTIDNKTIRKVLGQRPFEMRKDFKQYIENA